MLIAHWLLTEVLKIAIYIQIYFSFPKDGPEFIGEFPVCPLHFALFAHFSYFRLVANLFFPSVKFQLFPLLLMLFNHAHIISIQDYYKTTN